MLSFSPQATRAQRLPGYHSRTRVVLRRRPFFHIPQTVLRKMRRQSRAMESMPLLGRPRPRSLQQGVPRLQEHCMRRVPVSRPPHHGLPSDQSLCHSIPRTNHQPPAPYAADNRQPCFSFNNRKCSRLRCRYLHICNFCGGAHARVICPVFKAANKKYKNYLSTPVNVSRLATELAQHPDREFREYLLLGLIQGFNPGVECALSQNHICNNLQSALAEPDTVNDLIAKEVKSGFMIGPFDEPPFKIFRISPIGIATRKSANVSEANAHWLDVG